MHPRRTQHTIVLLLYIKKKQHEQISRRYCVYDTKLKNETAITNEISVLRTVHVVEEKSKRILAQNP
jgi:hypothetical protein